MKNLKTKKERRKCEGEVDNEKHKNAKYRCLDCSSEFCVKCADDYEGHCPFCEPPYLVEIK